MRLFLLPSLAVGTCFAAPAPGEGSCLHAFPDKPQFAVEQKPLGAACVGGLHCRLLAVAQVEGHGMKVEVIGTGCAKCNRLYDLVQQVVADTGVAAEVVKVDGMDQIMRYGILFTPALVVDGAVKVSGSVPKAEQVAAWLQPSTVAE